MTLPRPCLPALLCVAMAGCGDPAGPVQRPASPVMALEALSGGDQVIRGGERSPEPFRVRALDARGTVLSGVDIHFTTDGEGGGVLSQPRAVTDSLGLAETWLLDARSGAGRVEARAGAGAASFPFFVERAPGRIVFEPGSGATGLPSLPHPDSLIAVTLLDTDDRPLENWPVWFSATGEVASYTETTDEHGRASTRLLRSGPEAGDGAIFAFVLGTSILAADRRPVRRPAQRVLIVSIEGLRGDDVERYAPPTLSRLAREGRWTDRAESVLPTLTVPAHLSMLAGVPPEDHGIRADRMEVSQEMAGLEPLFRRARRGGVSGAAVMSRDGPLSGFGEILECRQAFGLDHLTLADPSSRAALEPALEALGDPEVELVFVHLPDVDAAGHAHGWLSPAYHTAVLAADSALGVLVAAVSAPDAVETLVLVTAPHGGGGILGPYQHGSASDADRLVPVILWGAGITPGPRLESASLLDVAPTTLWALGLAPPSHYRGRPLVEAATP